MTWRTNKAVVETLAKVEDVRLRGVQAVRNGKPGVLSPEGELGPEFETAYNEWMRARACAGDPFAISIGYKP